MSSIFDSITVPSASLEVAAPQAVPPPLQSARGDTTQVNTAKPAPAPYVGPGPGTGGWIPQTAPLPLQPASQPVPTGLVASMETEQFRQLVAQVGCGTVLRCPIQAPANRQTRNAPPGVAFRYVFPSEGVTYVTLVRGTLSLAPKVRVVDCLAVAYEGKPLGGGAVSV